MSSRPVAMPGPSSGDGSISEREGASWRLLVSIDITESPVRPARAGRPCDATCEAPRYKNWSEREDLNLRPPAPHCDLGGLRNPCGGLSFDRNPCTRREQRVSLGSTTNRREAHRRSKNPNDSAEPLNAAWSPQESARPGAAPGVGAVRVCPGDRSLRSSGFLGKWVPAINTNCTPDGVIQALGLESRRAPAIVAWYGRKATEGCAPPARLEPCCDEA